MKKSTKFALGLLGVGIVCCIVAAAMGVKNVLTDGSTLRAFQYQEEASDITLPNNVDDTTQIVFDIDSAQLTVQSGDSWSLSGGSSMTCEMNGNTLSIKQKDPSGSWYKSKSATATLTVPTTANLTSIDIDVDTGGIAMTDITASQYIKCEVDTGSVDMQNMLTGQLELDCDVGGIAFSGEVHGPVELSCDVGNIDVELQNGSTVGRVIGEIEAGDIRVAVNSQMCVESSGISKTISADLPGALGNDLLSIDCDSGTVSVLLTAKTMDETETT